MPNLFWSGVAVSFQSALAASVAITGISKASPAVVSHGGADPSDGDYVLLKVEGMNEVNSRVFRVANAASGTFELEGVDSTLFETFTSGTFEVVTFGNSLNTITGVSPSGGEATFADTSTIHDTVEKQQPVSSTAIQYGMTSKFDPSNAGLNALKAASDSFAQRAFMFTWKDGSKMLFNGYVSFPNIASGQTRGLVDTQISITADGTPTLYAS